MMATCSSISEDIPPDTSRSEETSLHSSYTVTFETPSPTRSTNNDRDAAVSNNVTSELMTTGEVEPDFLETEFLSRKVELLRRRLQEESLVVPEQKLQSQQFTIGEDRHDFCESCIGRLQLQVPKTPSHHATREIPLTSSGVSKSDKVFQSSRRLEMLRWEAVRHRMQSQIKAEEMTDTHNVHSCLACRAQSREIAKDFFIRQKLHLLSQPEFSRRLEQHLYYRDSATLVAEVVNSCTQPATSGKVVWTALQKRMSSMQNPTETPKQNNCE